MTSSIKTTFGSGGSGLNPGDTVASSTLAQALRDLVDDIAACRAAIIGVNAKLDADAGVTDTNYTALWTPAAQTCTKG